MSISLLDRWRRLRVMGNQITSGGSWAVQLSDATQHNLRNFFFDGLFQSASDSIVFTYLTLFVLALGASSADIGLMAAISSLSATLFLIPGAMLVDRIGKRKRIVLISGGISSRVCLFSLALTPFFFRGPNAIFFAIILKVIMEVFKNFSLPAWVSLSADIVPLSWRGRYFATRNLAMGVAAIIFIYGVGQLITLMGEPQGYQWAISLAGGLGLLSALFFSRIRDYRDENHQIPNQSYTIKSLLAILRSDSNFLAFCIFSAFWTFSLSIAGPFFNVFLVKDLSATAGIIGIVSVVGSISSLPAQKVFGKLVDRWGSRRLMHLMALIIPVLPIYWYFIQQPWQAIPINITAGILWAGMNLASFNFLLDISPQEQRARYSAMYQIAIAFSTAMGASLGGVVADTWGIRLVFILSGIGRLLAGLFLSKFVHQPNIETIALITDV